MKKLTSKFVKENCYFILYDYLNDDKIIYYFDSFEELSRVFDYPCSYIVHQFNICGSAISCIYNGFKYNLHLFIDEELVAQNRETI